MMRFLKRGQQRWGTELGVSDFKDLAPPDCTEQPLHNIVLAKYRKCRLQTKKETKAFKEFS